jgi:hypothetical protein
MSLHKSRCALEKDSRNASSESRSNFKCSFRRLRTNTITMVRSCCKSETTLLLSGCGQQAGLVLWLLTTSLEVGFESVWNETGWHDEASHLYYSAGWLFESEQAVMLSLQKAGAGR